MSIKSIYLCLVVDTSELFISSNNKGKLSRAGCRDEVTACNGDLMGRSSLTQTILSIAYCWDLWQPDNQQLSTRVGCKDQNEIKTLFLNRDTYTS